MLRPARRAQSPWSLLLAGQNFRAIVVVSRPSCAKMPRKERAVLTPEPGTIVGGKYRMLHALGEGGMGTVYAAENLLTLKRAAIKWLHPRLIAVQEASQRLLHEARATARIRHRNVVDIYDVVLEGESVFLVMELLLGEQLSTFLAREQLAVHEVIALLLPAMRGVAAAHAVGVVHRDIKPDNIFLAREAGSGELAPKVIDFGISRIFEADGTRLTRSGMTMGTPRYVSYEQLRGLRDVDARCDVYAFGVMLYESVVGSPPYEASTFGEQAISFVTTVPRAPRELRPELPEPLDALIRSAIAKEREGRPASMGDLIAALEPFAHAAAYGAPLPARCLELSARPAVAGPAGTTAPLTPTPVPSDSSGSRSSAVRASSARRRWRERALQLAALGLFIWAVLFVVGTWIGPTADGSPGRVRDATRVRRATEPRAPATAAPELTDQSISPSSASFSDVPVDVRGTSPPAELGSSPAAQASHRRHVIARNPPPQSAPASSTTLTIARVPAPISEQSKVERALLADGSAAVGADTPRDKSTESVRSPDEASSKPEKSAADAVHRAGRLHRKEF
jgi:eukaryotic-like serine/threonine-protein kinase